MRNYIKSLLLCLVAAVGCSANGFAQTPKYAYTSYVAGTKNYPTIFFHAQNNKAQCIYYPSNFPTMPSGIVTAVYLRMSNQVVQNAPPITYNNFSLKIGYTTDSMWRTAPSGDYDTFKTGLVTIVSKPTYTFTDTGTGKWLKFLLDQGSFFYFDKTKKFVLELEHGYFPQNNLGFDWLASNPFNLAVKRSLAGPKDSFRITNISVAPQVADLGFDVATTGVPEQSNISILGIYPNPVQKGERFQVGIETQQPMNNVLLSLTNVAGQQVLQRQYAVGGVRFHTEIEAQALPAGLYLLRIAAGGEVLSRKVMIE